MSFENDEQKKMNSQTLKKSKSICGCRCERDGRGDEPRAIVLVNRERELSQSLVLGWGRGRKLLNIRG